MPGSQCVVGGCNNKRDGNISLHTFPADTALRETWVKAICATGTDVSRAKWNGPNSSRSRHSQLVCSEHFLLNDFTLTCRLHWQSGLKYKATLNENAVPSLFGERIAIERSKDPVLRAAFRKRECERIIKEYEVGEGMLVADVSVETHPSTTDITEATETPECENPTISALEHERPTGLSHECESSIRPAPEFQAATLSAAQQQKLMPIATGCTAENQIVRSKEEAMRMPRTQFRNKRVQVNMKTQMSDTPKVQMFTKRTQTLVKHHTKMVSAASQYLADDFTQPNTVQLSKPVDHSTPRKLSVPRPVYSGQCIDETFSTLSTFEDTDDPTFRLDESDETSDDSLMSEPESRTGPREQRKFVVFEDNLLSLFAVCPQCGFSTEGEVTQTCGSSVTIHQECTCGYKRKWDSQPKINNIPAGNLLISAAVLFAGCCPTKVFRMFGFINLVTHTVSTYWTHQRQTLWPAIDSVWTRYKRTMFTALRARGGKVIVAGDGRADSPGHSAKYGCYSLIDLESGKVIEIQLVQSNEVKSSYHMELEGLKRAVSSLEAEGISIMEIITDRHLQIQKWLRENLPHTIHSYDVWHMAKGLKKKLLALAKEKECGQINSWIKSITNHLYWSASSTQGNDGAMILSKWKSVANHIQDIHEGHDGKYSKCRHEHLDDRDWLKPGSKVCVKAEDIILSRTLLRDIPKMSTGFQTSQLEAFHSVVNQFAAKMYGFGYLGQYYRQILSCLHFNENSMREEAVDQNGEMKIAVKFPKYKTGDDYTVKTKRVDMTFTYVSELIDETINLVKTGKEAPSTPAPPPPLTATKRKPSKEEAREKLEITRFKKMRKKFE